MTIVLIDNGSLAAAAHRQLRATAAALSAQVGVPVHAISWKHSDRVPAVELDGAPAATLAPWLRAQFARGEVEFLFVPFFISVEGAIGSALRRDLALLQREAGDFAFTFSAQVRIVNLYTACLEARCFALCHYLQQFVFH